MNTIQDSLESLITAVLERNGWHSEGRFLDLPQDKRFGDLSTNIAMRLARLVKKPPAALAATIIAQIQEQPIFAQELKVYIQEIRLEGAGFINFYFNSHYYYEQLKCLLARGPAYFRHNAGKDESVLIEFVSANPTGSLSVAHARQAAVGDVLANIFEFAGFSVSREY